MSATKTQLLTDKFRELILSNSFPEGHLPGERELAEQFAAGRRTVRDALGALEREGLVDRRRRTGTIVRKTPLTPGRGIAGLVMRSIGHIYAERYHHLLMEFTNNGYAVQSVSTTGNLSDRHPSLDRAIETLLSANPTILIVDGYSHNALPYLDEIKKRHPIFIDFFDSGMKRLNTGVWVDYHEIGRLAGEYLIKRGCKHPIFLPNWVPPRIRLNPNAFAVHKEKYLIDGFKEAMTAGGIDPELAVPGMLSKVNENTLLLSELAEHLPDGFCSMDTHVQEFMKLLMEYFGHVTEKIVFCGIGNTPWSGGESFIPFTSVDMNQEDLARIVVEQAALPFEKRSDIMVTPKLIIRERNCMK